MDIDEAVSGLTKRPVDDGIVARQVDLLLIGFGYAVNNRRTRPDKIKRHDLLRAGAVDPDSRITIEAVAPWFSRELGVDEPK